MQRPRTIVIFWLLMLVFLFIACQFFLPALTDLFRGTTLFLLPIGIFSLLGLALMVCVIKEKEKRILKIFLLLTSSSALGFFVFVFLHNAFYAFGILTEGIPVLNYLMEGIGVVFFLVAVIGCPLGFLVGTIGTIVLLIKGRKKQKS